jgi:hypothetical protein
MPVDFESSPLQFLVSRQETHPQITQMIFQKRAGDLPALIETINENEIKQLCCNSWH